MNCIIACTRMSCTHINKVLSHMSKLESVFPYQYFANLAMQEMLLPPLLPSHRAVTHPQMPMLLQRLHLPLHNNLSSPVHPRPSRMDSQTMAHPHLLPLLLLQAILRPLGHPPPQPPHPLVLLSNQVSPYACSFLQLYAV